MPQAITGGSEMKQILEYQQNEIEDPGGYAGQPLGGQEQEH